MTEWVQSKYSKDAPKFEVTNDEDPSYVTVNYYGGRKNLLRLEYPFCDSPEIWENVTAACSVVENNIFHLGVSVSGNGQYRVRGSEVNMIGRGIPNGCQKQWAFVVELRKPLAG